MPIQREITLLEAINMVVEHLSRWQDFRDVQPEITLFRGGAFNLYVTAPNFDRVKVNTGEDSEACADALESFALMEFADIASLIEDATGIFVPDGDDPPEDEDEDDDEDSESVWGTAIRIVDEDEDDETD